MAGLPTHAVLDGGMATELVRRGHEYIDKEPLWSSKLLFSQPEEVSKVHESFLEAGADIIETNTYQASITGFQKHLGLGEEEAAKLMQKGAQIAIQARDAFWEQHKHSGRRRPLVAGSLGPYGASLHDASEYTGSYVDSMSIEELCDWHRPHIRLLLESGVDLIAMDTIPAQKEAEAIVAILGEFPHAHAWISFSCQDGERICHGERLIDAASAVIHSPQVVGVGINCTSPLHIESLLHQLHPLHSQTTLLVYPNSGEMWSKEHEWSGRQSCLPLASYVPRWLEAGAGWIGGCCRTAPDDIRGIRTAMQDVLTHA